MKVKKEYLTVKAFQNLNLISSVTFLQRDVKKLQEENKRLSSRIEYTGLGLVILCMVITFILRITKII